MEKKSLFINGSWVSSERYSQLKAPYSNEVIAEIPIATDEHLKEAIEAAKNIQPCFANLSSFERASILNEFVTMLRKERDTAAQIIALEAAKPLKYAYGEVDRTIETYLFASEEAKRIVGEVVNIDGAESGKDMFAYTIKEPIGIIGAITPFNFPMNLVAHKIGPALAAGNCVILKPAAQTPLSAYFIAELFQRAGLPNGVLNVLTGSGAIIGEQLVRSTELDMITFTGSPEVGMGIIAKAGLKKVSLELGSNAGLIVDDGIDIDAIIERIVMGSFSNQGQVCISLQRIYIHKKLYKEFLKKFLEKVKELKLGDPLEENTDVSSLISQFDTQRSIEWIEEAIDKGAVVETGGELFGNILKPTVLSNVSQDSKVCCNEVFAPIVMVQPIETVKEGVSLINNSRFGLQAGIYTNNISSALKATRNLKVGGVIINDIPTFRVDQMPYGGVKESGNTKEGIKYAIEEMMNSKLVVWNEK